MADQKVIKITRQVIREILAISFWGYLIIKLFFFDIDNFIIASYFQEYSWIIRYKFFIIFGSIATFWLITKNSRVLNWTLYILFYPIIFFFWKVPVFLYKRKSWNLAFGVINYGISFFKSFKYNFIANAFFLISATIALITDNRTLIWLSISFIFGILIITVIRKFLQVFKPSSIYQVHAKIFSGIRRYGTSSFSITNEMKDLPVEKLTSQQLEKRTVNLQSSVLFNRVCLFAGRKIRDYQTSGINIFSYVFSALTLILFTVFCFALINFGLFHWENYLYQVKSIPSFFYFFYFSFNNLLFNSIPEIVPVSPISQTVLMIQQFFSFFLGVIFISLFISMKQQRHADELNSVIQSLTKESEEMETFIIREYKLNNIDEAINELEKMKASLFKVIFQLSTYIRQH